MDHGQQEFEDSDSETDDLLFDVVARIAICYENWPLGRTRIPDMIDMWMVLERLFDGLVDQVFTQESGIISRPNRRDFKIKVIELIQALVSSSRNHGFRDRDMVLYSTREVLRKVRGEASAVIESGPTPDISVCGLPVQLIENDSPYPYILIVGHIQTPWCVALLPGNPTPIIFANGLPELEEDYSGE